MLAVGVLPGCGVGPGGSGEGARVSLGGMASVRALVKPELLEWARKSARLDRAQAAHKAQLREPQLAAWEAGQGQPTISQLRKLARVYRRPLAVFYLPREPRSFDALHDFRRFPEGRPATQTPELAYEIRRAWYRREVALDLYRELVGEDPKPFALSASLEEDAEDVAVRLREALGLGRDEAGQWRSGYDALNRWRSALEDLEVLVFQAEDVAVSEMRGFSISQTLLPVIAVNLRDAVSARVFSMLHEAAHLMLHDGGLCDVLDETSREQERIEVFCNRVAGAVLVPRSWLLDEDEVRRQKSGAWADETIVLLSQRYRVSREVILRRLLVLGRTSEAFYRKKRRELEAEFEARQEEALQRKLLGETTPGFVTPSRMAVSTAGPLFVRLVLSSYHREKITASDLAGFLEVRLKHLPKIEQAVMRRPAGASV